MAINWWDRTGCGFRFVAHMGFYGTLFLRWNSLRIWKLDARHSTIDALHMERIRLGFFTSRVQTLSLRWMDGSLPSRSAHELMDRRRCERVFFA